MALQINKPQTFQLKVAKAKVEKQEKDGPLFFILPPLLVLAVIAFCYIAPSPAAAKAAVAAAPAPAPEEEFIEGVVIDESAEPMAESSFIGEEEAPMDDAEYVEPDDPADDAASADAAEEEPAEEEPEGDDEA